MKEKLSGKERNNQIFNVKNINHQHDLTNATIPNQTNKYYKKKKCFIVS